MTSTPIQAMSGKNLNATVIKNIIQDIKTKKLDSISILDLGTGQGYNPFHLAQKLSALHKKFTITCVDINKDNFRLSEDNHIHFIEADLNNKELVLGTFDFVIGTEIIEHLENPYHFIRLCVASTKKEGICYITTPNVEHIFSLAKNLILGRPMWFSVDEPSGHIMPIYGFMIHEAIRRITQQTGEVFSVRRFFNRNCLPIPTIKKRITMITIPGNNRVWGEINIFKIKKV